MADGLAVSPMGPRSFKTALPNVDKAVTVRYGTVLIIHNGMHHKVFCSLCSENEIAIAILRLVEKMKTVVEGAGATALAACLSGKLDHLKGKKYAYTYVNFTCKHYKLLLHYSVVVVLSGANIDTPVLIRCLEAGLVADEKLATFRVIISDRPGPGDLSGLLQLITEQKAR